MPRKKGRFRRTSRSRNCSRHWMRNIEIPNSACGLALAVKRQGPWRFTASAKPQAEFGISMLRIQCREQFLDLEVRRNLPFFLGIAKKLLEIFHRGTGRELRQRPHHIDE